MSGHGARPYLATFNMSMVDQQGVKEWPYIRRHHDGVRRSSNYREGSERGHVAQEQVSVEWTNCRLLTGTMALEGLLGFGDDILISLLVPVSGVSGTLGIDDDDEIICDPPNLEAWMQRLFHLSSALVRHMACLFCREAVQLTEKHPQSTGHRRTMLTFLKIVLQKSCQVVPSNRHSDTRMRKRLN